jgi:hypothetical protein
MRKFKVITEFSDFKDAELDVEAAKGVKGLTGNKDFTFAGNELKDFTNDSADFHKCMSELATGGKIAVTAKNTTRSKLEASYSEVAVIVNLQANGDLAKLQGSGIPLTKQPKYDSQSIPVNFRVENGANGVINVAVDRAPVSDHGTVFAYTPVANAPSDINLWTLKPVNGHSAVIKGLPAGVPYLFSAAYKGRDDEDFVWAAPITKYISN